MARFNHRAARAVKRAGIVNGILAKSLHPQSKTIPAIILSAARPVRKQVKVWRPNMSDTDV
jgi:hypothetical protein